MNDAFIRLDGVSRIYQRGGERVAALDDFTLAIEPASFYAFMGPSGSGKSTLLNLIGGLDRPDSGAVSVDGERIDGLDSAKLAAWRAEHVGFVFQGFNLIPVLTALENVELPLLLTPLSRRERRRHALKALELVGMLDRQRHRPSQLSGGQEQRTAIARAIATDPRLILADEPTGDLDRESADAVLDLFAVLNARLGKTVLMVTHDPRAAARARSVVRLDKGRLESVERQDPAAPPAAQSEARP